MKLLSALPKQQMLGWEVMFKDCGHCRTPWLMKKNRSNDLLRRFYFTKSLLKVRWVPVPKKVSQQVQFPGHKVGSVFREDFGVSDVSRQSCGTVPWNGCIKTCPMNHPPKETMGVGPTAQRN